MSTGLRILAGGLKSNDVEELIRSTERTAGTDFWLPGDGIAQTFPRRLAGSASVGPASGASLLVGGCVIPEGETAVGIGLVSNGAAVTPTHQWFFLAIPDEAGAFEAAPIATTKDDTTTAWGANTLKLLSLKTADGGSGVFTAEQDTPVYVGQVQVAGTPATLRGLAGNGVLTGAGELGPKEAAAGPTGLTGPGSIAGNITLAASASCPWAYIAGTRA